MTWLGIIIIILSFFYILKGYFKQQKANRDYHFQIQNAEDDLNQAKENLEKIESPIYKHIVNLYGKNWADNVIKKVIAMGMPYELLLLSWGKPGDTKTNILKESNIERWYYEPYYNRLNNLKYKTEVTLENNVIVGWKDIN